MSNALRCEILPIVCKRSLGFMSHFRSSETFFRLVPVRGRPFGRILWFANGRGASRAKKETPRVRFSRPTSVTSPPRRGENREERRALSPRGAPNAHEEKGRSTDPPPLQPLRAASRGGSRSAARRTAAALGRARFPSLGRSRAGRVPIVASRPSPGRDPGFRPVQSSDMSTILASVRPLARPTPGGPSAHAPSRARGWHIPRLGTK